MFEIKLVVGGIEKTFTKEYINIEDNLLAVEHQVRQTRLYQDGKLSLNPKEHRKVNEAYLQMFVDMFGGQFKVDDLKQADASLLKTLEAIYIDALGGISNDDEDADTEKKGE